MVFTVGQSHAPGATRDRHPGLLGVNDVRCLAGASALAIGRRRSERSHRSSPTFESSRPEQAAIAFMAFRSVLGGGVRAPIRKSRADLNHQRQGATRARRSRYVSGSPAKSMMDLRRQKEVVGAAVAECLGQCADEVTPSVLSRLLEITAGAHSHVIHLFEQELGACGAGPQLDDPRAVLEFSHRILSRALVGAEVWISRCEMSTYVRGALPQHGYCSLL